MICKFFRGGRTFAGAKSAVNYLLNERVENGEAKVLTGNPQLTLDIIKNTKNKWKFSSGVLSFEELIDNKTKHEIIEEFKKTFFAGMNEEQYNLLIVEHTDKGRTELHFLIPRTELTTGKAFNPYFVKRDFKKKDLFQDYINSKYNLSSPHNAEKQELTKQPNPNMKKDELQEWIDKFITENIEQGLIQNSDDVKYFLEQAGFKINRQGKDYIGLQLDNRKIRLKGAIYGKDFRSIEEIARRAEEREREHIPTTSGEFEQLEQKLDRIIRKQAEYNTKRYTGENRLRIRTLKNTNKMDMVNRGDNVRDNNTSSSDNDIQIKRESDDSTRATTIRRIRAKREARARAIREAKRKRRDLYKKIKRDREELLRENREERRRIYRKLAENSSRQQAELGSAAAAAAELKRKAERNRAAAAAITEYRQEREQRFVNAIKRFSGAVREFAERTREYITKVRRGIDLFVLISQPKQPKPKQEQRQKRRGLRL